MSLWFLVKKMELNIEVMLVTQSEEGVTAIQLAAEINHVKTLQKL
jgi:bifunctional ADP-heptose synthase (sugar kinase/adenylyltransferase)